MNPDRSKRVAYLFAGFALLVSHSPAWADKVITKDGKIYTGKIMIDGDKAVLIGNPPFDPNSFLIQTEDIETIVYEQYQPKPPIERRRGVAVNLHLLGNVFSSGELAFHPAPGLMLDASFRFHPLVEIGGGLQWEPSLSSSSDGLAISNGSLTRGYDTFWRYSTHVMGKAYPFFKKTKWKTEPYLSAGYGWSHLTPKSSGDSLRGSGWSVGAGAIRPLRRHIFLDGHFAYQNMSYDTVHFLGQKGSITPDITQHTYSFSVGLSYRF